MPRRGTSRRKCRSTPKPTYRTNNANKAREILEYPGDFFPLLTVNTSPATAEEKRSYIYLNMLEAIDDKCKLNGETKKKLNKIWYSAHYTADRHCWRLERTIKWYKHNRPGYFREICALELLLNELQNNEVTLFLKLIALCSDSPTVQTRSISDLRKTLFTTRKRGLFWLRTFELITGELEVVPQEEEKSDSTETLMPKNSARLELGDGPEVRRVLEVWAQELRKLPKFPRSLFDMVELDGKSRICAE